MNCLKSEVRMQNADLRSRKSEVKKTVDCAKEKLLAVLFINFCILPSDFLIYSMIFGTR